MGKGRGARAFLPCMHDRIESLYSGAKRGRDRSQMIEVITAKRGERRKMDARLTALSHHIFLDPLCEFCMF
jgi:hypothetical protein